jgi:hypothetical protein
MGRCRRWLHAIPGGKAAIDCCALKAPGIAIGYLSAWRSKNSERFNAVTAAIANECRKTAKKKLCFLHEQSRLVLPVFAITVLGRST